MSVKIKVSYTDDRELTEVVKRLHPVRDVRKQPAKGRYNRAYIDIKCDVIPPVLVKENAENP